MSQTGIDITQPFLLASDGEGDATQVDSNHLSLPGRGLYSSPERDDLDDIMPYKLGGRNNNVVGDGKSGKDDLSASSFLTYWATNHVFTRPVLGVKPPDDSPRRSVTD